MADEIHLLTKVVDKSRVQLDKMRTQKDEIEQERLRIEEEIGMLGETIQNKHMDINAVARRAVGLEGQLSRAEARAVREKECTPTLEFMATRLHNSMTDRRSAEMQLERRAKRLRKAVALEMDACDALRHSAENAYVEKDRVLKQIRERREERLATILEKTKSLSKLQRAREKMLERELERKRIAIGSIEDLRRQEAEAVKQAKESGRSKRLRLAKEQATAMIEGNLYDKLWDRLTSCSSCDSASEIVKKFLLKDQALFDLRLDLEKKVESIATHEAENKKLEADIQDLALLQQSEKRNLYGEIDVVSGQVGGVLPGRFSPPTHAMSFHFIPFPPHSTPFHSFQPLTLGGIGWIPITMQYRHGRE